MRYLGLILVALMALSSCDSREDWFDRNDVGPDIEVTLNGVVDTISKGDSRVIDITLHTVGLDGYMLYTDTVSLKVKGLADDRNLPLENIFFNDKKMNFPFEFKEDENHEINVSLCHWFNVADYTPVFDTDTAAKVLATYSERMSVMDAFGKINTYTVKATIIGVIPPTPVLEVKKLEYPGEYNLSLEKSFDKDGKVMKYEWCIDGNIVPYKVTDSRFENRRGEWQGGQAAYGGKYVKATTISSMNHSFQTSGEHTVYYRCMDDMGIWSMWYSEIIKVER